MAALALAGCRSWRLSVSVDELDLDRTLGSGQAFLWQRDPSGSWTGPIKNKLFSLQRVSSTEIVSCTLTSTDGASADEDKLLLKDYLCLDESLVSLYKVWSSKDENFAKKSVEHRGIRLLSQQPVEALVAFISSTNNNIRRIHSLMINLCRTYGQHLGCHGDHDYYSFPSLSQLCEDGVEERLRSLGFGYRAKYIHQTVVKLSTELGGEKWLEGLRKKSYYEARQALQQFPGVGGKVADCICLMSLGHMEAVPVDVHISRLAVRDYGSQLPANLAGASKSLSTANYKIIGDHFRRLFGDKAGWAQAVLFAAEVHRNNKTSAKRSSTSEVTSQTTKRIKR